MNGTMNNKPTFVSHNGLRFLISDRPDDANIQAYVDEFTKRTVKSVVRACDPSYSTKPLTDAGIEVLELSFADGDPPPPEILTKWLDHVDREFDKKLHADDVDKRTIAVHCVAGLGRAPVLVAVALVESGLDPLDAVTLIRQKRRGAINARQLRWLEQYQPRRKQGGCCVIQ